MFWLCLQLSRFMATNLGKRIKSSEQSFIELGIATNVSQSIYKNISSGESSDEEEATYCSESSHDPQSSDATGSSLTAKL